MISLGEGGQVRGRSLCFLFVMLEPALIISVICYIDIPRVSAGSPPFIIQEEFDRYEGFSWQSVDCTFS